MFGKKKAYTLENVRKDLKSYLEKEGLSVRAFAKSCSGVSHAYINEILNGRNADISLKKCNRILEAIGKASFYQ